MEYDFEITAIGYGYMGQTHSYGVVEIDLTGEEMQEIETALARMDIVGMGR